MSDDTTDSMIGRTIGAYTILEEIGRGAMGVVYRGVHAELQKQCAIKLLPPQAFASAASRQRLREEARDMASVQHPNVAVVHDYIPTAEYDGIVMELVSGPRLDDIVRERGTLPEGEVVQIGIQLADGLAAAHAEGVVHRDLKPANLHLTSNGRLKILDFGLARRLADDPIQRTLPDDTVPVVVGTGPYIAPEIWSGGSATPSSDLYSAGVVLYQLATGTVPFPDLALGAIAHAVTTLDPPSPRTRNPAISPVLDAVIMRCLQRDPSRRFASAQALKEALEAMDFKPVRRIRFGRRLWAVVAGVVALAAIGVVAKKVTSPPHTPVRKIVVLPFHNLTGDPSLEYLSDGTAIDLTTELAEYAQLQVTSVGPASRYRNTTKDVATIARELRRDGVIEGTIQFDGDKAKVSARLFDANEKQIWHQKLTVERVSLPSVPGLFAHGIAVAIGLTPEPSGSSVDSVARILYWQGRYEWNQRSEAGIRRSIGLYERAIAHDSLFALAWSGLADSWSAAVFIGMTRPTDGYPRAKRAALRALALNPNLSEAWVSLGNIVQNYDWNWAGADSAYLRAIALNPENPVAHHWYANHCALAGDFKTGITEIEHARQLDPLSLPIAVGNGAFRYYARDYQGALTAYGDALAIDSTSTVLQRALAADYLGLGREDDAAVAILRWLRVQYAGTGVARQMEMAYRAHGFTGLLRALIAALEAKRRSNGYEPATHLAELYAVLGNREQALHWLEIARVERDPDLNRLKVDRIYDPLRKDPRFERIERAVGFEHPGHPATP